MTKVLILPSIHANKNDWNEFSIRDDFNFYVVATFNDFYKDVEANGVPQAAVVNMDQISFLKYAGYSNINMRAMDDVPHILFSSYEHHHQPSVSFNLAGTIFGARDRIISAVDIQSVLETHNKLSATESTKIVVYSNDRRALGLTG